jgi:hypothetical protein
MAIVRFAAYRQYEATRTQASNAMMALLAGAQLAAHMLKLTEGSQRLLPEVFPQVEHITRFNLTSEAARQILNDADAHLGAMSVPYALALHEDYLKTCLSLLETAGRCAPGTAEKSKLVNQHTLIETATGGTFSADSIVQLDTIRRMRNCLIHAGGRADTSLLAALTVWTPSVEASWIKLAKTNPKNLRLGDTVSFGHGELLLTLAVTKVLAREANVLLQNALPAGQWADMVIEDMITTTPNALSRPDALRRAKGLARHHYAAIGLTGTDVQAAIARR